MPHAGQSFYAFLRNAKRLAMDYSSRIIADIENHFAGQSEFIQACKEVLETLQPVLDANPKYEENRILERITEPERTVMFRVSWFTDKGELMVNRGYRIQFNSALGPYKGGLRFHPSVNLSILKFLGFEQIFKNALSGLSIGGAKGGSDFNPKGRSDGEIMRFCQAFMTKLYPFIGMRTDVPAGDIGVGGREVGYLFGAYKQLTNRYEGVLTGKNLLFGGSLARTEATGYGCVYFAQNMLAARGLDLKDKVCAVSGAGNVAIYCCEKLWQCGAKPVTVTDSTGMIYDPEGIDVAILKQVKEVEHARLTRYAELRPSAKYTPVEEYPAGRHAVWDVPCFAAFPCATQNEVNGKDAEALLANGCQCVCEGANMPSTPEAIEAYLKAGICYGPAKAANAGGVSVSQLEMAQNANMVHWTFEEVDNKLKDIMKNIYTRAANTAKAYGEPNNLLKGANISAFCEVADAMIAQGMY